MTTVNPGPESLPPGLVTYIAEDDDKADRALRRTLTSLADRGWLVLTPEDTGASTARINGVPSRGELPEFEVMVLSRVLKLSRAMPTVPLSIVTDVDSDEYRKWKKGFTAALDDAARAFGLTTRFMRRAFRYPVALLTAALGGFIGDVTAARDPSGTAAAWTFYSFFVGLVVAAILSARRLTESGKSVAAWGHSQLDPGELTDQPSIAARSNAEPVDAIAQVTDRTGAYPASVPATSAPLSSGEFLVAKDGRPPPAGRAWSSQGGRWHLVTVGPVQTPASGRPLTLAVAGYAAAFATLPASLIGLIGVQGPLGHAIALVPAAVFVFFGTASWFPRFSRRLGIPRRVVYRGQVVKHWVQTDFQEDGATIRRCCCIDDGLSEAAQTFSLKARTYKRLSVGDTVQVTYSPRWQLLRRIRKIT